MLDLAILGLSTYLTSMVFVAPAFETDISPFGLKRELGIGLLSIFTFFLSILQLRVDWKGKSEGHRQACSAYALIRKECKRLASMSVPPSDSECQHVLQLYSNANEFHPPIPERFFLKTKQHHKVKVEISRLLDSRPGTWLLGARIRIWIRDTTKLLSREE